MRSVLAALICLCLFWSPAVPALAQEVVVMATTTSTENSGLLDHLLPPFEKKTGIKVRVVAVGTGKALALARRCDVDLVMVHAPSLEKKFVAQGNGVERRSLMHNYFMIVGPPADPAQVGKASGLGDALARLAAAKAPFVSRGDQSGTHVKELELWKAAGIRPGWKGYREAGQGMGAVLTMANQMGAYTLTDSGTFIKYSSLGKLALKPLWERDDLLYNPYSVILVSPKHCPSVKAKAAKALSDFLVSPQGQKLIGDYRAQGRQLFWPDVKTR